MPEFKTEPHKDETVNGYRLKCYESDPYYYVEVFKEGEMVHDCLLMNDEADFEKLKDKYKKRP